MTNAITTSLSYLTIRKVFGNSGMLPSILVPFFAKDSLTAISESNCTVGGVHIVRLLVLLGVFLIPYQGSSSKISVSENVITWLAVILIIIVSLILTKPQLAKYQHRMF
ncbi:MAG: hypothetical protein ABJP45_18620 [Cyclobacteriaceae bacterium]